MNWLNKLIRGPDSGSTAATRQSGPARPAPQPRPAADTDALRQALAAAVDPDDCSRRSIDLGAALGQMPSSPMPQDPPLVWVAAVCHAADKTNALAWLQGISGEDRLADVAVQGRHAEVRLSAAQRIGDGSLLEQVARQSRHKDNRVYQHCSDVLRQRRESAQRLLRAGQLAGELGTLLAGAPVSITRLLELEKEVHALGADPDVLTECHALIERAGARVRQETEDRRALQALHAAVQALAAECAAHAWPGPQALDQWLDRLGGLVRGHAGLPSWLEGQAASRPLAEELQRLQARLAAMAGDQANLQACERFLDESATVPIGPDTVTAWESLQKPAGAPQMQALQDRWQALQQPAPAVPDPPETPEPERPSAPPPARIDLAAVRTQVERLEQALEQGHLSEADAAAKQLKALVGGGAVRGDMEGRLQRAHARLGDLKGWAQWGAARKRDDLLAAATALSMGEHGIDHLAVAVPELREQWKQLNSQAAASKEQWEHFDAALTQAYRPVAKLREEEAALRAQARAHKESLCAQWESEVASIAWEGVDFGAVESRRQQMLDQWRAAAQAGFRDERLLRKRLDALIAGIDRRFDQARADEIRRREELICAADALRQMPDLRQATTQAKVLQERWRKEAGPARLARGDEQKLWQRFRAACDALFARRDTERAGQLAEKARHGQARRALLDAFASTLEGTDSRELKRALGKFRADWDAGDAGAGDGADGLQRRARELQQLAQQRIDAQRRLEYRARLEQLAQQAAPVDGLDSEALASGQALRESLLIDLEIELGLPTPQAHADARRLRQLARLQGRFRTGSSPRQDAEDLLARWYATAAQPHPELDGRMASVISKLVEQQTGPGRT